MNLVQIAKSWYKFAVGSPETQQLMEERLAICDGCEFKEQLSSTGQLIVTALNKQSSVYRCGKCKCPLAGKTAEEDNHCPLNKW